METNPHAAARAALLKALNGHRFWQPVPATGSAVLHIPQGTRVVSPQNDGRFLAGIKHRKSTRFDEIGWFTKPEEALDAAENEPCRLTPGELAALIHFKGHRIGAAFPPFEIVTTLEKLGLIEKMKYEKGRQLTSAGVAWLENHGRNSQMVTENTLTRSPQPEGQRD